MYLHYLLGFDHRISVILRRVLGAGGLNASFCNLVVVHWLFVLQGGIMSTLGDLLYQAVDGSFAIDSHQRIIFWDPGCEELLGYSEQWVLGRPCCDVLNWCKPASDKSFCQQDCYVAKMSNGGVDGKKSFLIKAKDKNNEPLTLSVSIILVPATCKNNWHVMHLLHRAAFPDVLTAMDNASHKKPYHANNAVYNDSGLKADKNASRLTPREMEVLALLSEGLSGAIISRKLNISSTTVRNHIQHIQGKLGVHSKTEAVAYAYRHKFL
jgi:DNA-binding CsgD family transcriptional regulator